MICENCMVHALVLEDNMLHMSNGYPNCLVALFDILVIALLVMCRYMRAVMPRKLYRKAEVAVAIAGRVWRADMVGRFRALQVVVCHGGCEVFCCLRVSASMQGRREGAVKKAMACVYGCQLPFCVGE